MSLAELLQAKCSHGGPANSVEIFELVHQVITVQFIYNVGISLFVFVGLLYITITIIQCCHH